MNGSLAQLISLTAWGSAVLAGLAQADSLEVNSTFRFVGHVEFAAQSSRSIEGVPEWFEILKRRRTRALRLGMTASGPGLPQQMRAAFAGAAPWVVRTVFEDGYSLWTPNWSVGNRNAPQQRIWTVVYNEWSAPGFPETRLPIRGALDLLRTELGRAERFARTHEYPAWADVFQGVRAALDRGEQDLPYHADMLPPVGYSEHARVLLAACTRAFVFGGMGSWNDLGPFSEGAVQSEYQEVSAQLFHAVMHGCMAAANSFEVP